MRIKNPRIADLVKDEGAKQAILAMGWEEKEEWFELPSHIKLQDSHKQVVHDELRRRDSDKV